MQILTVSIGMDKIDESKIVVTDKGKRFFNLLIEVKDEKDQYQNDVSVSHNQTKEDREAKLPKVYLGNGKKVWESKKEPF
jgi:hypothetical protein